LGISFEYLLTERKRLTDMVLIADDMGADSVKVAGMHLLRLISVIAFYPAIISILLPLLEV